MRRGIVQRSVGCTATAIAVAIATVAVGSLLARFGVASRPGAAATAVTTLGVTIALWPAYAPRPRRLLDRLQVTAVGLALGVGTLGFLGSLGLGPVPSPVVLLTTALVLLPIVPAVVLTSRPTDGQRRVLLVGDDAGRLGDAVDGVEASPLGYLSPPRLSLLSASPDSLDVERLSTDGGVPPGDDDEDELPDGRSTVDDPDTDGISGEDPDTNEGGVDGPHADVRGTDGAADTTDSAVDATDGAVDVTDGAVDVTDGAVGDTDTAVNGTDDAVDDADGAVLEDGGTTVDEDGVESAADGDRDGDMAVDEATLQHRSPDEVSASKESELASVERLSGLCRLSNILRSRDVDAVVLSYSTSDRQEFFGALRCCRELGVEAKVHEFHAPETLLTDERTGDGLAGSEDGAGTIRGERDGGQPDGGIRARAVEDGPILDVSVEPLPPGRRVGKRAFDVCFATVGLVALAPLIVTIAAAIKLDSPGPVLYGQRRTARLGRTFTLLKFRSMVDGAEDGTGPTLSDEDDGGTDARVTRVGRVLRATHLDEIPQLLAVLRGDMTVVGPRPERPELDAEIAEDGLPWERRWFVKPGLTGLAQINDVTAFQPARKLAYDLEYVECQSLLLDARIVLVQIEMVLSDALDLLRSGGEQ